MGLDVYLQRIDPSDPDNSEFVDEPWPEDPEHLCRVGYLRSSYNDSGFERICRDQGIPTWSEAFGATGELEFVPDWEKARTLCLCQAELLASCRFRVASVELNRFSVPLRFSPHGALLVASEELSKKMPAPFGGGWSGARGEFYPAGIPVVAAVPGEMHGRPCVHLVYRDEESFAYYATAARIAAATCDYVLNSTDPSLYRLYWSS